MNDTLECYLSAQHAFSATGQPPRDPDREAAMRAVFPEGQRGVSGREAVTLSIQVSSVTYVVLYM